MQYIVRGDIGITGAEESMLTFVVGELQFLRGTSAERFSASHAMSGAVVLVLQAGEVLQGL